MVQFFMHKEGVRSKQAGHPFGKGKHHDKIIKTGKSYAGY